MVNTTVSDGQPTRHFVNCKTISMDDPGPGACLDVASKLLHGAVMMLMVIVIVWVLI